MKNSSEYKRNYSSIFTWDAGNRLTAIVAGTTTVATYGYDPSGRRVSLTAGTETTIFPTDSYAETNGVPEKHVSANGSAVGTIRGSGTGAQPFWNFVDHLNSTRFVTDAQAKILERTAYLPFGTIDPTNSALESGNAAERKKYTGHEFDVATNLTYAGARYLDTNNGRFLSQDSVFINNPERYLADPQQQNSYAYTRNNPIKYVDPNGESATLIGAIGGGIVGGIRAFQQGGNWQAVAKGIINGATVGALAGSVIDTGGLSLPAVAGILNVSGVAEIGVDLVDFGVKKASPEKFTAQQIKDAQTELIKDSVLFGASKGLSPKVGVSLDILTKGLDIGDQYFGDKIYKNVNQKYQNSSASSPAIAVSGGSTYSFQQQLNQVYSQLLKLQEQIIYLQSSSL